MVGAALVLAWSAAAVAQVPTGPMDNPGEWQRGGKPTFALHPFGASLTGNPAKNLPVDTLKVPPGFKVEVWAEVPNAREMALGAKGSVWVGNIGAKSVYVVMDQGDKRVTKEVLKGLDTPNGVVYDIDTLAAYLSGVGAK